MKGYYGLIFFLFLSAAAQAHKPSDSYLTLDFNEESVQGQWDIALRDLEYAISIDSDGDGIITWGEVKERHQAIAAYALARLQLTAAGRVCLLTPQQHLIDQHSDGFYAVLRFASDCPASALLALEYRLFFDLDPTHRGLLRTVYPAGGQSAVLSPERNSIFLNASDYSYWPQFADYWREGVWHIWIGFDHILFLFALLLPAVLRRENRRWLQVDSLRRILIDVAGVVTAFTVAHSITLAIAALGWVSLPARWVESAIAATVVLAALNNLYPFIPGRRWLIAFFLGLIHGFGFASVLADLGLPDDTLLLALIGFNLGVETGQLAIVAGFIPVAFLLRGSWLYRRAVLQFGSLAVFAIAVVWFVERSANMKLLPM